MVDDLPPTNPDTTIQRAPTLRYVTSANVLGNEIGKRSGVKSSTLFWPQTASSAPSGARQRAPSPFSGGGPSVVKIAHLER